MTPQYAIYALWCAWLVSWVVAMFWSNRTEKSDAIGAELVFASSFASARSCCLRFHRDPATTRKCSFGTLAMR
jgi:hypothetical protein